MQVTAQQGDSLANIDTPALIVDLEAYEHNLKLMMTSLEGFSGRLRPHAKTHKCGAIGLHQMAHGAVGVCCQKVSEAQALVQSGVSDVLVTNQIVGEAKINRLLAIAGRAKVAVCADDVINIDALSAAASSAGATLDVLVEIDVGSGRCGVDPGADAVALASRIDSAPGLRFGGLQAYQGSAQHLRTYEERRDAIQAASDAASHTRELLRQHGLDCPKITGAGTGTYLLEAGSGVYDELQPGSYIFMDADYARNSAETGQSSSAFRQSLFILTTVMSHTKPHIAVLDAGLKSVSIDSGLPLVWQSPGITCSSLSDDHCKLTLDQDVNVTLGQRLRIVPGHCDPTVNLHDHLIAVRGDRVEDVWRVDARGAYT